MGWKNSQIARKGSDYSGLSVLFRPLSICRPGTFFLLTFRPNSHSKPSSGDHSLEREKSREKEEREREKEREKDRERKREKEKLQEKERKKREREREKEREKELGRREKELERREKESERREREFIKEQAKKRDISHETQYYKLYQILNPKRPPTLKHHSVESVKGHPLLRRGMCADTNTDVEIHAVALKAMSSYFILYCRTL